MAITRVTSQDNKGAAATSTVAVSYPGKTAPGNLLIATVWTNIGSDTVAITGWTKRKVSAGGINNVTLFDKVADGTEASVSASQATATSMSLHIYEFRGNANPLVVEATAGNSDGTSSTTTTFDSVTITYPTSLIFAQMMTAGNTTNHAFTAPFTILQNDTAAQMWDGNLITTQNGVFAATATWTTAQNKRGNVATYAAATYVSMNNYLFVKVGDGMTTGEKIR